MDIITRLVLLSCGLCLVFYDVNAVNPPLYGSGFFNQNDDLSGELASLKRQEANLQTRIRSAPTRVDKWYLEMDLQSLQARIAQMEATLRVPYHDYLQTLSGERRRFEREKAELRRRLAEVENQRLITAEAIETQERIKGAELASYREKLKALTDQRNKIAKQYAASNEKFHQQEEQMKRERNQFLTEKEEMEQTLDAAKTKHAKAFDAVSATPTEGYKPVNIPEQEEINKLKNDLTVFNGMTDRKQLKEGLETTKTKIEELLERLYQAGKFSTQNSREELMSVLSEMEKNIILKREKIEKEKASRVEKMKLKNVTNYDDEEIESLQKTSQQVNAADIFHREIARRGAYLKGIVELSDLWMECSDAIRDANERNLANLWAEAIQEAADNPLGQLWAKSLQDAKDSDLAKAWADVMQDAKNSQLAKAWTNAIEEAKDINLAQVWTDAVTNLQNSPLTKMWSDAVNNAKDSPFTKYCANAIQNAKNTLCDIVSKK